MAAGRFVVPPYFPARDRDFNLLSGALLYVYQNETTTKANIYTDEALTVLSSNPVVANSSGQFPAVYAEAGTEASPVLYSVSVTTSTGASPGNPFNFDNYRPSVDWETAAAALADAAALAAAASAVDAATSADEAAADAVLTAADLAAIEAIIADAPDAPSVLNKLNRNGDNAESGLFTVIGDALTDNGTIPTFQLKSSVAPATIKASTKSLQTLGYSTNGVGGARYTRTSYADIVSGGYPAASYVRSLDRFMPDGSTDATNGGYWLLAEKIVRPEMFGAVGDGSTNDTVAVQAAFTFGPTEIIGDLTYKVNSAVTGSRSVILSGMGTFDCSAGGTITISGTLTAVSDLSANVLIGATTLSFTTVTGISAFDDLVIYNPTDYSWSNASANYRAGEFVSVATISGTTVTITGTTVDAYTAAAVDVYRLNPVTVHVSNVMFIESTTGDAAPLRIVLGADCSATNVRVRSSLYGGMVFERCVRTTITGGGVKNNSVAHGLDYGVVISNCQDFTVLGGSHSATRHAFTIGGNSNVGCVPNRNGKIIGCTLRSSVSNASADMHGNCEFIDYVNCNIYASAAIGGANIGLIGCNIYQRATTDGCCVVLTEINGGQILIDGCTLYSDGDGASFGYIHWDVGTLPKRKTTVVVRDLVVTGMTVGSGGGSSGKILRIIQTTTSSTMKIDVDMRGVRCNYSALDSFLQVTNSSGGGTFYSDGLIVDDVYGPAFTYLIRPEAEMAAVPTREMTQTCRAFATTTAAASLVATAQVYRLRYSRIPRTSAPGVFLDGGGAAGPIAGKIPVARPYEVTAQALTMAMYSADGTNFTAGVFVEFSGEVGIRDI